MGKDLNSKAIESMKSKDVKAYLKQIGYRFSLEDITTILWNNLEIRLQDRVQLLNDIKRAAIEDTEMCRDRQGLIQDIEIMIKDCQYIMWDCLGWGEIGTSHIFTTEGTYENTLCFSSMKSLYNTLDRIGMRFKNRTIGIIDGEDASEVAYLDCNKSGEIVGYTLCKPVNGIISKLYDNYIYIPNNFEAGDVVVSTEDEKKEKWVIVDAKGVPEPLASTCEYSVDTSAMVVPMDALDSSRGYKEQIDEMNEWINNRKPGEINDLLSTHDHIHISFIERAQ